MLDDRDRPSDGREDLEAALVLHYSRLVRIAYLALPPEGDRHSRVLAAHAIVQRTLTGGPRQTESGDSYAVLRAAVVRSVLSGNRRLRVLRQPYVWGLRLFPLGGGSEEMQMDAALRGLSTTARMAYVLLGLEELTADEATAILSRAGARAIPAALDTAEQLLAELPAEILQSSEFDPCTLRTRPSDLSRRRRRVRGAAGAGVAAVAVVVAAVVGFSGSGSGEAAAGGADGAADAAAQAPVRIAADAWKQSARVDFGIWPARGDDTANPGMVGQALEAWTVPHSGVFHLGPGASGAPPILPVHVLWTGTLDGANVVLLYDGTRLARYTVPHQPAATDPTRLDVVRADDSDLTTAGAVVLRSSAAGDRWLVAPWVDTTAIRDLRTPESPARMLATPGGVTAAVPRPAVGSCASWPVLQLQSSPLVAEHHSFLLADLSGAVDGGGATGAGGGTGAAGVTGTHLTYSPPPKAGPAQAPREGTGPDALAAEARAVCGLGALANRDVKQVDTWAFAQQTLPANQGIGTWICLRADDWSGTGTATGEFLPPAAKAPATVTGTETDGKSCTRFGQNVVAQTRWKGPDGRSYLLMAGSRHVVKLAIADASGAVRPPAAAPDHTAAAALNEAAATSSTAVGVLDTGETVRAFRS